MKAQVCMCIVHICLSVSSESSVRFLSSVGRLSRVSSKCSSVSFLRGRSNAISVSRCYMFRALRQYGYMAVLANDMEQITEVQWSG